LFFQLFAVCHAYILKSNGLYSFYFHTPPP